MKKRILIFVLFALLILVVAGCSIKSVKLVAEKTSSEDLSIGIDVIDSESADLEITDLDIDETEFEALDI